MGLLVIDEISMADPKFMNKLNEFCTTLMQIRKGEIELRYCCCCLNEFPELIL